MPRIIFLKNSFFGDDDEAALRRNATRVVGGALGGSFY
jgi:hypothetical protein